MDVSNATGLMAFWSDIDADYLLRFQEWHTCEHMPERVSIPGFLRGRRYRAEDGGPHFLMMYETDTPAVLCSEAYLAALNAPTDWTREALTHFRAPSRNIYLRSASAGAPGAFGGPWISALRFNREGGLEGAETQDWLEAMVAMPAIERAQIWAIDEQTSGIQTSERRIYGGGPGEQQFLLLVEANRPHDERRDPIATADADVPSATERRNAIHGRYWLESVQTAPSK